MQRHIQVSLINIPYERLTGVWIRILDLDETVKDLEIQRCYLFQLERYTEYTSALSDMSIAAHAVCCVSIMEVVWIWIWTDSIYGRIRSAAETDQRQFSVRRDFSICYLTDEHVCKNCILLQISAYMVQLSNKI